MTHTYTEEDLTSFQRLVRSQSKGEVLSREDIEDIVQNLLLVALTTKAPLGIPLVALAVQTARWPRYYMKAKESALQTASNYRLGVDGRREDADGQSVDPDEAVADTRWRSKKDFVQESELRDLIARLPVEQAQAFTLCGEYGYTYELAAETLGVSAATVARNLTRARETLQQQVLAL